MENDKITQSTEEVVFEKPMTDSKFEVVYSIDSAGRTCLILREFTSDGAEIFSETIYSDNAAIRIPTLLKRIQGNY